VARKKDLRPNQNIGRVQRAEPHWNDHGDSGDFKNYPRGPEAYERAEREAYERPYPAAYRYLLGPSPSLLAGDTVGARSLLAGDTVGARAYLSRIEAAIEQGGWTRSEARRLRRLRDKWRARATGTDPRFKEVGNRRGGLNQFETANVKARRTMAEIKEAMMKAIQGGGD
jgi:hypothetical protein